MNMMVKINCHQYSHKAEKQEYIFSILSPSLRPRGGGDIILKMLGKKYGERKSREKEEGRKEREKNQ